MTEKNTCEVTEKFGATFGPCGMPAEHKCKEGLKIIVCKDHLPYALVAGWKPEKIKPPVSTTGIFMDANDATLG